MLLVRCVYAVLYAVNLAYNMLKSAVSVCLNCLTGGIRPEVVTVKTVLKKPFSQVVLANSITLTPGTITADIVDGEFYVHALSRKVADDLMTGEMEDKVAHIFKED